MRKLYAYADEATFFRGSEEVLGTGIFISEQKIDQALVSQAMALLDMDRDFDLKIDIKTIKHGYFHASEDSKNAHSHFCRTIVEKVSGNFAYSYLSKKSREDRTTESLYRLTLKLVSSKFMDEPCDVEMIVEERVQFGQASVTQFLAEFNREYANLAHQRPGIINIFSKISMTIADKKHPGLQVVDFMLWSMNRSMLHPPNTIWRDRLALRLKDFVRSEKDDQSSGTYYLNKSVLEYSNLADTRISYPYAVPTNVPNEDLNVLDYYQHIETIITYFSQQETPHHCQHWQKEIQKSTAIIASEKAYNEESLKSICYTFIYIFDTMPIYKDVADDDKETWLDILYAKRLAGIIVTEGAIHNQRTRGAILRWKWELKNQPS